MPYQSRHAGRLADLLMRQGEIEGARAQNRGNLWGGVVKDLAGIPAGMQQDRLAQQEFAERQQDREMKRAEVGSQIDERTARIAKQIRDSQNEDEAKQTATWTRNTVGILGEYAALSPEAQQVAWPDVRQRLADEGGWEPEHIPSRPMPTPWVKGQLAKFLPVDKAYGLLFPEPTKGVVVGPGGVMTNPETGEPMGEPVPFKPDAPPAVGSFEDYLTRAHGANPTPQQIESARKVYQQSDDRPFAPVVIQTGTGPQILNREAGTTRAITDQSGSAVEAAPTADMRNKIAGRQLVAKSISAIKSLSQQIITKVGPEQRAAAISRGAEAVFGNDPQFRTYQDARMALAGNLAVAQQGSRPSDADIRAIWLPLVPDPYRDTSESSAMKWGLIETMSNVDQPTSGTPKDGDTKPIEGYPGTEQTFRNGKWIRTK